MNAILDVEKRFKQIGKMVEDKPNKKTEEEKGE